MNSEGFNFLRSKGFIHQLRDWCGYNMSKTMDSNVSIGPKPLGAVSGDNDSPDEFLGYFMMSTTGELHVPHEWLVEKWGEYGLPETYYSDRVGEIQLLPDRPSRWSAYRRTVRSLLDEAEIDPYTIEIEEYEEEFTCKFSMEKSDEMGSNVFIVYANTFWPEELIGEDGGDWRQTRLGYFDFYRPEEGPGGLTINTDIDKDNVHYPYFQALAVEAKELFKEMTTHLNGQDFQRILEDFREHVFNATEIRRSVYFVGAHHEDNVSALASIWGESNEFKEDGEDIEIKTSPVVNLEDQREMVAESAREMVEEMVDDIVDETIEEWEEEEDRTAEEAARAIMDEIGDAEGAVAEYNQLVRMELSVKDILRGTMEDLAEEQGDIIQRVLDQQDLTEFEE